MSDTQFETLALSLCQRPGMYVSSPSTSSVCAYLSGFDAARSGGPLQGLKEWLVVRSNGGDNLTWESLALSQLMSEPSVPPAHLDERLARLGDLLTEFFGFRATHGLTTIFYEYSNWLLNQDWYVGSLRYRHGA